MIIRGKMTRRRLERLKEEGLITQQEALEHEAALFLDSKRTNAGTKRRREARKAAALAALSDAEVREKLRYTEEDIRALNESIHAPMRNAGAVQAGLKLKAMVNGLLEARGGMDGVQVTVTTIPAAAFVGTQTVTAAVAGGTVSGGEGTPGDDDSEE